jgi:WD40 repeat protein
MAAPTHEPFNLTAYYSLLQRVDERVHMATFAHQLWEQLLSHSARLRAPAAWALLKKVKVPLESERFLTAAHSTLRHWVNYMLFHGKTDDGGGEQQHQNERQTQQQQQQQTQQAGAFDASKFEHSVRMANDKTYKLTQATFVAHARAAEESQQMIERGMATLNQFVDEEHERGTESHAIFLGFKVKIEAALDAYLCALAPIVGAMVFAELLARPHEYTRLVTQASRLASHMIRYFLPLCQRTLDTLLGSSQTWLAERFIQKSQAGCNTDKERRLVFKVRLLDATFVSLDLFVLPKQYFIHSGGGVKWIAPANRRPGVIATASYDGTVAIFAFQAGDGSAKPDSGEFGVAADSDLDGNDKRGSVLGVMRGHKSIATWCAFSPNDHFIYSTSFDGTVRKWEAATGNCLRVGNAHTDSILCADLTVDGEKLCTSAMDTCVKVWDTELMACTHTLKGHELGSWVKSCAFMRGGRRVLSAGLDKRMVVWGLGLEQPKVLAQKPAAASSAGGDTKKQSKTSAAMVQSKITTASTLRALRIVDGAHTDFILAVAIHTRPITKKKKMKTTATTTTTTTSSGRSSPPAALLQETEDLVASISKAGEVIVWNMDAAEGHSCVLKNIPIPNGQSGWPCCVAFSHDVEGSLMVVGCINNVLLVYSTEDFKLIRQIRVQNSGILCVLFTRDSKTLLVGTVDGTVQRLDLSVPINTNYHGGGGHHHRN